MKKIILKTAIFVLPFLLLHFSYIFFYSTDKGDLIRVGYIFDNNIYNSSNLFQQENKKEIKFKNISEVNLNVKNNFTFLTIGDSFSDQENIGYQNYLADKKHTVLHYDRFLHDNPIETLYSILNGDLLNTVNVKYIILQSSERDFIDRAINADNSKTITTKKTIALIKRYQLKKDVEKERNKKQFFSRAIFRFPLYNLYYNFDDNAFFSQTYQVKTKSNLFSTNNHKLLFYAKDIEVVEENNNKESLEILNNHLNILSKKLNEKGIKLIVLPSPDKFGLYYNEIINNSNYPKPMFFENLEKMKKNYLYLDSKKLLSKNKKDIYYYDDSHWSPYATKLIAQELSKIIK